MKFLDMESYQKFDEKQYNKVCKEIYGEYLKIRNMLPKDFVKIYEDNAHFHDMHISGFAVKSDKLGHSKSKNTLVISMGTGHFEKEYDLIYENVLEANFGFSEASVQNCLYRGNLGSWMYDELYEEDGVFCHNIMLAGGKEINVRFIKIKAARVGHGMRL